jgi:bacterial/archaeal transporter family-2 protein
MSSLPLVLFTLFAASLLPIQAAFNAAINRAFDKPALVVIVSLTGSAIFMVTAGLASGRLGLVTADRVAAVPWWAWFAGVGGAIFLFSQPLVAPRLGTGTYQSLAVTAQVVAALVLDHFGLFGLPAHAASPLRLLGAAAMAVGVVCIARG